MAQADFDKQTIEKIVHHILPTNATLFRDNISHLCDKKKKKTNKHYNIFLFLAGMCKPSGKDFLIGGMLKTTT